MVWLKRGGICLLFQIWVNVCGFVSSLIYCCVARQERKLDSVAFVASVCLYVCMQVYVCLSRFFVVIFLWVVNVLCVRLYWAARLLLLCACFTLEQLHVCIKVFVFSPVCLTFVWLHCDGFFTGFEGLYRSSGPITLLPIWVSILLETTYTTNIWYWVLVPSLILFIY